MRGAPGRGVQGKVEMSFGSEAKPAEVAATRQGLGAARVFALLAAVSLGAILPMLMVVANKSAPAVFGTAALFANAAAVLGGEAPALKRRYAALLKGPTARIVWLVVALCAVSFAWTVDPGFTRRGLVEGLPELAFALCTAAAWPLVARREDLRWLVVGLVGAALLIAFEKLAGMPLHALVRARGEAWDLKRSAVPPALLFWPAAAWCLAGRRFALAGGLLAAALAGVVFSHSGAPGFALGAGIAVFVAARVSPRFAAGLVGAAILLLLAAGPFTGTLAGRLLPAEAREALREEHASHRLQIWSAFEDRVHDRPLLGHGFDTSFRVSEAPRPDGTPPGPDNTEMVDNHPHNVVLQFWVELGLAGALAAALGFGVVLLRLARLPAEAAAPRLGLLVSTLGVGLVGLSAWQPWWIATLAVACLWFDLLGRTHKV